MRKVKVSVRECYKMLFELEDKIEFLNYYLTKQLDNEKNIDIYDLKKIEKQINEVEFLVKQRNELRQKLQNFDSLYVEINM